MRQIIGVDLHWKKTVGTTYCTSLSAVIEGSSVYCYKFSVWLSGQNENKFKSSSN